MLKKPKVDKPAKEKPSKDTPSKDKPAKGGSTKGGKPVYFWDAYLNKRKAAKANIRESAVPKTPMSREDKLKLMGCGAIVLLIPIIIIIIGIINSHQPAAPTK